MAHGQRRPEAPGRHSGCVLARHTTGRGASRAGSWSLDNTQSPTAPRAALWPPFSASLQAAASGAKISRVTAVNRRQPAR